MAMSKINRTGLFAGVGALFLSVCVFPFASAGALHPGEHDGDDGKDDRARTEQSYELAGFDRIDVSGVYNVDVTVGGEFSVSIKASARERERTDIYVEDGVLKLAMKKGKRNWDRRDSVDARIVMPALNALEVSGVVDGKISGIDAEGFEVEISGVGDMELSGQCGRLRARVSGVGDLNARGLECRDANVRVSGVGDATVFASESVDASASGVGDIDVFGNPSEVRESGGLFSDVTIR